ncbi:MAG TPA: adenylate/guanylate cyclase domain-containing protein [Leptospiraceae bacterium]|nr:adenylate/guanylate cyclase domain-containing protein [Leptospiraceae bacterium]HMW05578.1 adenylate/guanylate cyclase domain-containing protein [Leptospiraceae bacterium]HMY31088.1 adenylate/guanylate cyclase domain-containing protein [Leptospiraceae bacterium]HMZ65288.1 adenylate/guanylate cyclase domain-containing protein [Leptospiraceae bacterium]HNA05891.1 adenylate/guanylate cyclase domain-containing protein [Leptospiraceae bacterium]
MEENKPEKNRIQYTPDFTMDAIPILDINTSITEIHKSIENNLEPNSDETSKEVQKPKLVDEKTKGDELSSNSSIEKNPKPKTQKTGFLAKMENLRETPSTSTEKVNSDTATPDKPTSKAKYSLQLKMMLVISIVIATTVSVMIALATYFFKDDNQKRIDQNNLDIVRIINSKVVTDLVAEINKGKILALTLKQEFKSNSQKRFFIEQYFKNDNSFLFLGVYKKENGKMETVDSIFNQEYLKKVSLTEEDVISPIHQNLKYFSKSFEGVPTLLNTSPGTQETTISISIPLEEGEKSEYILVILLRLEKILDAFKKSGINTTYMVNEDGMVLAHPDPKIISSGKNFMTTPIVRQMLTSQAKNELKPFQDTDGKKYLGAFQKLGFANAGIISVVEEDLAYKAVYQIQQRNILIMIISICVSLIIVFIFAKSISNPLLKLLDETIKISKGIFQLEIKRTTNDEVGVLTDYFQSMAKGLEEREKVKSMLGSMIDPIVVSEGMRDLAALKRGDEKMITAFFSDVAGFSTISEQLNSVQLAGLLNEYLSAMTIILKNNEGVLDKYIGDAIVGIFGAPVPVNEHYIKAARASLEMIHKLKDLREYWTKNNLYSKDAQEMDIRIGLNTGLAKVGFMGTDAMGSYTMMGDTVNLAARLEAAAKDYGVNILISESVKTEIEKEMFTRELDLVRVKGKNEPVKLYELISNHTDVSSNIKEATGLYEEGFKAYLRKEWLKSIQFLQQSEKAKGKKDKACRQLIERCEFYKTNPPDSNWDGVYTRTHK